ncbi:hypothetical protein [Maribacter sp. 2308TA10-17]|uniref:hypothetical protein n=1 Tax=Maribacter sp. 2308TA10-17 TaxID=3386276 RepID=UPI0039BCE960
MRNKILAIILFSLLILGCDEQATNMMPDELIEQVDTEPPIITISGLESPIETITTLNVTIQDESDKVSTSVLINEQEVSTSNEKSFSFEVNPFDYMTGENTIEITSNDEEGNEVVINQTFDVKKLLVSISAPSFSSSQRIFFSVNTMTGNLLAFKEVMQSLENIKLYADDDFVPQQLVVTSYDLQPNATRKASLDSYANIKPGTDLTILQEVGGVITANTFDDRPTIVPLTLDITGIDTIKLANSLWTIGNGFVSSSNPFEEFGVLNSRLQFNSKNQVIENAIVYTSNLSALTNEDKIEVDDYKYLFLEEPSNSAISFSEFKTPPNTEVIDIPASVTSHSLRILGFRDQEAYRNNQYRFLYDTKYEESLNSFVEIPVIDEFEVLRNDIVMQLNSRKRYVASTLGIKNISDVPDWDATLTDETIQMTGEFDKFTILIITLNNPDAELLWEYTAKPIENFHLPFESFEFPDEFVIYSEAQNLNLSSLNSNTTNRITFFDASEQLAYEELLFNIFTNNRLGDVYELSVNL